MEAIEKAKILLGIRTSKEDEKLETLQGMIFEEILEFTGLASVDSISESLVTKMLVFKYRKLGFEAINSQSYSGISESYIIDYPADIMASLNSYKRKMRCF